ncbi:hypothetical protein NSQ26_14100 [Bacillus sp. FSL W7-1360]
MKKVTLASLSSLLLFSAVVPTLADAKNNAQNQDVVAIQRTYDINLAQTQKGYELSRDEARVNAKLKIIAALLRAGGWALEKALRPFSKKNADLVLKYRHKIADVLEEIETVSEMALTQALRKAGIAKKDAEAIAKVIIWIVL